ncbi:DUF3467 domain-containing protein [Candidatus Falkowbacteria bacterium]|jgi:hypothetical protein|nr:MAG: DUF3467 domain-containing protein [Candidatus Falkowbacteria bacterium]
MSNENKQEIQINDTIQGGEYANIAWINHNEEEFHLIFGNIAGASGKIVSKIMTTPGHFKRMIAAMTDNLKKYEEKFGPIKQAEQNEKEIGFKGQ